MYSISGTCQEEMDGLANRLEPHIGGTRIRILTSPSNRTKEGAEILRRVFSVEPEELDILLPEMENSVQIAKVVDLLEGCVDCDVVILVTHLEFVMGLPRIIGDRFLDVNTFPTRGVEKGQAWLIDLEKRTCERVCS